MATPVPLGRGAYERLYTGAPVVELLNRWVESNPTNLREGVSVLARPGTVQLGDPFDQGSFEGYGSMRGNYTLSGLFDDSLFVVCGDTIYMIEQDMTVTPITGTLAGEGTPEVAWQAGAGYERLWISDGLLLQYFQGESNSSGTVTLVGPIVNGTDKLNLGGVYYVWGTSFSGSDAGTNANPYVINPTSIALGVMAPLDQLVLAVTATGSAGVDYSATLLAPHATVTAISNSGTSPSTGVRISALTPGAAGDLIVFTRPGGTGTTVSGSGTLASGGVTALQGCTMPDGVTPGSITQVSGYVLVSQADTQKFFWINPGEVEIDPLNFAFKESSPDPIITMRTVGDQVMIMGAKSTENWYATGNIDAPFAPIEGRVYARGVRSGTPVVIDEGIILVGDDGRVYQIGQQAGVDRISNNSIEERIRYQTRREEGLTP